MKHLLVDIESTRNLEAFLKVVESLDFVKSVKLVNVDQDESESSTLREPQVAYDWINPSRPASENEIDELIQRMDKSSGGYTTGEVRKKMEQWAKQKTK